MKEYLKLKRSFTLIELLVVIAIIGLLSSVILVNLSGPRQKAKITKALEFSQSVQHALGAEAVGVWNFDEGSGTLVKDASGYGNNGTIYGASFTDNTPYKVVGSGQGKYALSFDGVDDYVNAGNSAVLNNITNNITIEFWFNSAADQAGFDCHYANIISKHHPGGCFGWGVGFDSHGGTEIYNRRIYFIVGTDGWGEPSSQIANNIWTHVVITYNGTNRVIYINGVFDRSDVKAYDLSNAYDLWIGACEGSRFRGTVDEVRIYTTVLSIGEIQQHYLAGIEKHQQLTIK